MAKSGPGVVYDLRTWHRCDHEQSLTVHKQRVTIKKKEEKEKNSGNKSGPKF